MIRLCDLAMRQYVIVFGSKKGEFHFRTNFVHLDFLMNFDSFSMSLFTDQKKRNLIFIPILTFCELQKLPILEARFPENYISIAMACLI